MKYLHASIMYIRLCFRNIWRNRRRTLITMASIFIGTYALIMVTGYVNVMRLGIENQAISSEFGHIQIARRGYFEEDQNSYDHMMDEEEFIIIEDYLYSLPEVDVINKRLHIAGLIGNESRSTVFMGICGQSDMEIFMSPTIIEGRHFAFGTSDVIVIGKSLGERLRAGVDDPLLLFFSSPSGAQEAILVSVSGIYEGMMTEQENIFIYMPLETAWELMLERKIHRILVLLKDQDSIPGVVAGLETLIEKNGLDLEVREWSELATYYRQIIGMFNRIILVVGIIIIMVILSGISNTMYMVIYDRTREIGTLRALGDSRLKLFGQFMVEGSLLGLLGASAAVIAVLITCPVINNLNIVLPPGPGEDSPIPIYIEPEPVITLVIYLSAVLMSVLACVLPAIRAVRQKITDALHTF